MTITIPSKLTSGKELVIIPKEDYEDLLNLKELYEFQPTSKHKETLLRARKNRKKGKVLTIGELKQKLGLTD